MTLLDRIRRLVGRPRYPDLEAHPTWPEGWTVTDAVLVAPRPVCAGHTIRGKPCRQRPLTNGSGRCHWHQADQAQIAVPASKLQAQIETTSRIR